MSAKLPLIFLLLFCAFQFSEAQKWCQPGATWYFEENYSYFPGGMGPPVSLAGYDKAQYANDTVITRHACKVITDTSYYEGSTPVRANAPVYTYSSGDTAYFLNDSIFLPSFYFGCHTGDTLLVPWNSILVATYVDSTGIIVINGDSLRFYDYRAIDSIHACIGVVGGRSNGRIIERFGNVAVGPGNNSFSFDFSCLEFEEGYYLHCYHDDSFASYSTDSSRGCTFVYTSINDVPTKIGLTVSPNPADSYCRLQLNDAGEASTAAVYDITGKEILPLFNHQNISEFDFNIANLTDGIYFVKISDGSGRVSIAKLVKE